MEGFVVKKKFLLSFSALLLFSLSLFTFDSNEVEAVTTSQQLLQPEEGWERYDDSEAAFVLKGSWKQGKSSAPKAFYKGAHTGSSAKGATIEFEFKGTQLRLLTRKGPDRPKDLKVIIDGEEEIFSAHSKSFTNGFDVVYEKIGLDDKRHKVIIENGKGLFYFDAIDINYDGELLPIGSEDSLPDIDDPITSPDDKETNGNGRMYVSNNSIYKLAAGEVFSWGDNSYGQLGLGDMKKRSLSSKEKVNLPEKIIDLVVGKNFVIVLGESGKVYGWGDNTSELFGDNGGLILSPIEFDEDVEAVIKAE